MALVPTTYSTARRAEDEEAWRGRGEHRDSESLYASGRKQIPSFMGARGATKAGFQPRLGEVSMDGTSYASLSGLCASAPLPLSLREHAVFPLQPPPTVYLSEFNPRAFKVPSDRRHEGH